MTATHEHTCFACRERYYCTRQHTRPMLSDGSPRHEMHVRDGYRCCSRCAIRNTTAAIRFAAWPGTFVVGS